MTQEERELLEDIAARCKRTETRLARFLEAEGLDVNPVAPAFRGNAVHVPTDMCSIASILKVIPPSTVRGAFYDVLLGNDCLGHVALPMKTTLTSAPPKPATPFMPWKR